MNKNWKESLAKMIGVSKEKKATMLFEVDDATGAKLTFPDIADLTELAEGVAVTAENGEHVFEADGNTYTIMVDAGKVTKVDVVPIDGAPDEMSADTLEFVTAVAEQLGEQQSINAEMKLTVSKLEATINSMKSLMSHGKDDVKTGADATGKKFVVNGKEIDLTKVNLK